MGIIARYVPERESESGPRVPPVIADPRRFLGTSDRYDVIVIGMPDPDSGAANRFDTREFFTLAAGRLTPGGVLGLKLRTAENLWTPAQARRVASIHRALRAVFADVVVLPGATNILVASNARLPRDPAVLAERLAARAMRPRVVTSAYLTYLYTNDRRAQIARALEAASAEANTDIRPASYQYAAIIWLGRFWPSLSQLDLGSLRADTTVGRWARWTLLAGLVTHARAGAARTTHTVYYMIAQPPGSMTGVAGKFAQDAHRPSTTSPAPWGDHARAAFGRNRQVLSTTARSTPAHTRPDGDGSRDAVNEATANAFTAAFFSRQH